MRSYSLSVLLVLTATAGCQSPYYADRGAAAGGLAGAGLGAIIGNQTGDAGAGAAIGAGIGALTGAAFGGQMDELAAQNRAAIATQLGRPVAGGAASTNEIIAMSRAGVAPALIVNYINTSGVAQPPSPQELIALHQQGVANEVVSAMQNPPAPRVAAVPVGPPPVIVEEHHYGPPVYYHRGFGRRPCGPRVGWGVSISN